MKRVESALLFLTLLLLPTQLGKHFWPAFSFIYSLPIDYLSPTLYFWDLLVVCLWLISIWQKRSVNKLALNLWLIFLLTQAISLLGPFANIGAGLVRLEQYAVAGLFGVYLASISKIPRFLLYALILSVLVESILAMAQFIAGKTVGLWLLGERSFSLSTPGIAKFDFEGRQFLRPYATFSHPNVLASYMVMVAVFLTSWNLNLHKILRTLIMLLTSMTILLTVSRAAILTMVVAAWILLKRKGKLVLILAMLLLLPFLSARYSSVLNFDNLTLIRREELSMIAFIIWFKSPILGVGLNNFILAASDLLVAGPSRFLQPVHNIFLLALSETGLIGVIGLISLIGYPMVKARPMWLAGGIIVFLGLFDHYWLTLPQGYRLLFLIWGLSLSKPYGRL